MRRTPWDRRRSFPASPIKASANQVPISINPRRGFRSIASANPVSISINPRRGFRSIDQCILYPEQKHNVRMCLLILSLIHRWLYQWIPHGYTIHNCLKFSLSPYYPTDKSASYSETWRSLEYKKNKLYPRDKDTHILVFCQHQNNFEVNKTL